MRIHIADDFLVWEGIRDMDWPTRSTNLFIEHFKDSLGKAVDLTSTSYQDHPPLTGLKICAFRWEGFVITSCQQQCEGSLHNVYSCARWSYSLLAGLLWRYDVSCFFQFWCTLNITISFIWCLIDWGTYVPNIIAINQLFFQISLILCLRF